MNLKDAEAACAAVEAMNKKFSSQSIEYHGIMVSEMVPKGLEMMIGANRDATFGPITVSGLGGILVEILKDSTIGLPELTKEEALKMIQGTKGYRLLTGFRGAPKADVDALANTLVKVSKLAAEGADKVAGLDINPLLVYPEGQGVLAVDALIELQ